MVVITSISDGLEGNIGFNLFYGMFFSLLGQLFVPKLFYFYVGNVSNMPSQYELSNK